MALCPGAQPNPWREASASNKIQCTKRLARARSSLDRVSSVCIVLCVFQEIMSSKFAAESLSLAVERNGRIHAI